jgi:glycosyltransferase involved in cell wall biosynthesis
LKVLVVSAFGRVEIWRDFSSYLPAEIELNVLEFWKHGLAHPADVIFPSHFHTALRKLRPDVVVTDWPVSQGLHMKLAGFLSRKRVRYVVQLRGDIWKELRSAAVRPKIRARANLAAVNRELLRSQLILPVCKWLEDKVNEKLKGRVPTRVVYNGVDCQFFSPSHAMDLVHPCAGILQTHTILDKVQALADFGDVIKQLQEITFYIIAGKKGTASFFSNVEEKLGGLGNVRFLEYLSTPEDVRAFLSSIDIYALVSGLDCCPATLLEACAMRRPVVASDVGGIPEIITDRKNGLLAKNDDHQGWAMKLRSLLEDRELATSLGRAAREEMETRFDWKKIAGDFVSALGEVEP